MLNLRVQWQQRQQKALQRWLARRVPASSAITLTQKSLFILPTRQGLYFLAVVALLLLVAINYQNNLAYVLVFFLLSVFNTAILFTFLNVSGLQLRTGKASAVFAGEVAEFAIELTSPQGKKHHAVSLAWSAQSAQIANVVNHQTVILPLHCQTQQRGRFKPPRLNFHSIYPLGFMRVWSWLDLNFECIVYPKPVALASLPTSLVEDVGAKESPLFIHGRDDFYGFKAYQAGDALSQVHWRGFAKGQRLHTKVYSAQQAQDAWVDWYALPHLACESRLSALCAWVLALEQHDKLYGLRLPTLEISPNTGAAHRHQVLSALALFDERQA